MVSFFIFYLLNKYRKGDFIGHKKGYESNVLRRYPKKDNSSQGIKFVSDENKDYGIVLETTYNDACVLINDEVVRVKINSKLNLVINKLVFPGDKVVINNGFIDGVVSRKNMLCRDKVDGTKINGYGISKVVAVNVDLAVIVVSSGFPPLHPKFIDRYMILLKSNKIPFIIVMNKSDLKQDFEDNILNVYRKLAIKVIETSTFDNVGIQELRECLKDKQAIFVGHSGVGKSSLVNAIMNDDNVLVGAIGEKSKRGRHTTTSSKYYKWDTNSAIIDTPGIRSLDINSFEIDRIQDYFDEIYLLKDRCKFSNCIHYEEDLKDCSVKQAVRDNLITKERYESYVKIIEELKSKRK